MEPFKYISEKTEGLLYKDGVWVSVNRDKISYPKNGNCECFTIEDCSYWFIHRKRILLAIIKKYSEGENFFDIGGGNGDISKALQDSGFNVYLIEPGVDGINNAKNRGIKNLINATIQEVRFKENSMDNIGLFDVLEHIEDDTGFLGTIHSLLNPKGRIFITVPAFMILWSPEDKFAGHYRRYTLRSISKKLEKAGFKIVYKSYVFSFLTLPVFIFRAIPGILFKKGHNKEISEDHIIKNRLVNWIINLFTTFEYKVIMRENRLIQGSSCLIVARKN